MSITCGHCSTFDTKVKHDTIAQVRLCAQRGIRVQVTPVEVHPAVARRASITGVTPSAHSSNAGGSSSDVAVPAGRFAVTLQDGALHFFKVDRPTEGRWAGRVFVSEQASDDLHPVRGARAAHVLSVIALDVETASRTYGREIGSCGVCGRTLTDAASRAAGIGPVCEAKGF